VELGKHAPSCFLAATTKLLAQVSLPSELEKQIMEDSCTIGEHMLEMLQDVQKFQVKLEVMTENVCSRWHTDSYIWRAIVAYSCTGTEYMEPSNVDFWELENCGNSECVILDKIKILQADVGDIFLMKGSGFPEENRHGLVHKTPEPRRRADGSIIPRLVLKIDGLVDRPDVTE